MEEPTLRYKVGDLVKCIYDLFEHYEFFFDQNPESGYPFYGIIMSVQENVLYEDRYGYDRLYLVRCMDGHLRFFAYWEMRLVSTSS
jgi:hypothetical protein